MNIWCGWPYRRLYFVERTIAEDEYLGMLELNVFLHLIKLNMKIFQYNFSTRWSAPHYKIGARTQRYAHRWPPNLIVELDEVTQLPGDLEAQTSPQRTISFGIYSKNIIYSKKLRKLRHLSERIIDAIATVTPDRYDKKNTIFSYTLRLQVTWYVHST